MVPDEVKDVGLSDTVNVVALSVVPACALAAVLKPAALYPPRNLVMIFTQAPFQIPYCVAVSQAPGNSHAFALVDDGAYWAVQSFRNRSCCCGCR